MSLSKSDQIQFLESQLAKHKHAYYNENAQISDFGYDAQEDALKQLDPNNNLIKSVGSPPAQEEWEKDKHEIPMGSLDKVKNPEEFHKWAHSTVHGEPVMKDSNRFFLTEKLDGISIELIYVKGELSKAITRGDSVIGSVITPNVVRMSGVRKTLPIEFTGSLRGEIILRKSKFNQFFKDHDYANTRNAAGGVSKRLDGSGCEHLDILFYQAIGDIKFETEFQQLDFIEHTLLLQTPNYTISTGSSLDEHIDFACQEWDDYQNAVREQLDWDLDGLVVRINELSDQEALGSLHLRPYGAMAFKFKSESAETIVKAILLQTGNSGRITPVIEVEPVNLVGANIDRASLYNFGYINEIGLDVGAKVLLIRANDVIPRCEVVLEPTGTIFQPPTECPVCQGEVAMNGKNLQCLNTIACPAQVVGRLCNWINTLGILEWGDKLLTRLIDSGMVSNVADLYKLSIEELSRLERMGVKSATKCHQILWQHNPISIDMFLGGLSIPLIGSTTIQMLIVGGLDTLDKIRAASYEELLDIKGLGPGKAQSIFEGMKKNAQLIDELLSLGVKVEERVQIMSANSKLEDKVICITGSTVIKRNDLAQMIVENGGEFKNSITKQCSHLIIADPNSVSSKTTKAKQFGITLISEEDFLNMIA